jgi:peptidoglycan/LPS O-acetylase OafA/YrhL
MGAEKIELIKPASHRLHDLDALRAFAMLLGIGLHGALAYVTFPYWPAYDTHHSVWFDLFVEMIHGFRMPLFFLLSGFFTTMLWRRRGLASLIKHRVKRILLPLLLFMITVIPITNMVSAWALKSANARPLPTTNISLWEAAKNNDTSALESQAKEGAALDELDATAKLPPLCWAALNGSA